MKVAPTIVAVACVDDEARGAAGVLALEAGAGGAVGGHVDGAGVDAGLLRLLERLADRGDLRVGEGDPGRADAFGDRLDLAPEQRSRAATQAWYLPMWVSRARPLTSPIA